MTAYRPTLPPRAGYVEQNGRYVPTQQTLQREAEQRRMQELSEVAQAAFVSLAQSEQLDEAVIAAHPALFAQWDEHFRGPRGSIVQEEGVLYRALHDIMDEGQNVRPSQSPTIWRVIANPHDEWPAWIQPLGSDDTYGVGDRVSHNALHWVCDVDDNVWEPGVYGWTQQ